MNSPSGPRIAWQPWKVALVLAAGLACGITAAVRAAAIEPFVEAGTHYLGGPQGTQLWGVVVTARGGPWVTRVRVKGSAGVQVVDEGTYSPLAMDRAHTFKFLVPDSAPYPRIVRVFEETTGLRVIEVPLGEAHQ